jgi:hypothetical protein
MCDCGLNPTRSEVYPEPDSDKRCNGRSVPIDSETFLGRLREEEGTPSMELRNEDVILQVDMF